jgi:hypothetical protein
MPLDVYVGKPLDYRVLLATLRSRARGWVDKKAPKSAISLQNRSCHAESPALR